MAARKRAKTKRAKQKSTTRKTTRKKRAAQRAESNAQSFDRLREWLLPNAEIFAGLALHGNTSWPAAALVWLALCWAWSESKNVTDAFAQATEQCGRLGGAALSTYQGFMNALVTCTGPLMGVLWPVLHERMRQIGGRFFEIDGWVPIAFDGSRSSAPRSEVEFRGLKQTLDRAKLRCRNHHRLLAELNWSILAMAMAELFALKEQLAPPPAATKDDAPAGQPKKRSLANTNRALRRCLTHLRETPDPGRDLRTELRQAVTDSYHRKPSKKARYRPPNPDKKPLGDPKLRKLNKTERKKLDAIRTRKTAV